MLKIRKSEWNVLFHLLVNSGETKWAAGEIIDRKKVEMQKEYDKIKLKHDKGKLTEDEAEAKFKEKFHNMCQSMER